MKAPLRQKSVIHYNAFCSSASRQKLWRWLFDLLCFVVRWLDMRVIYEKVIYTHIYSVYI